MPLELEPMRHFPHGMVSEYRVRLRDGDVAILEALPGRGWHLTILYSACGRVTQRGLFATPHDVLMVLLAEYGSRELPPEAGASAQEEMSI